MVIKFLNINLIFIALSQKANQCSIQIEDSSYWILSNSFTKRLNCEYLHWTAVWRTIYITAFQYGESLSLCFQFQQELFRYAEENSIKLNLTCTYLIYFLTKHPEYSNVVQQWNYIFVLFYQLLFIVITVEFIIIKYNIIVTCWTRIYSQFWSRV